MVATRAEALPHAVAPERTQSQVFIPTPTRRRDRLHREDRASCRRSMPLRAALIRRLRRFLFRCRATGSRLKSCGATVRTTATCGPWCASMSRSFVDGKGQGQGSHGLGGRGDPLAYVTEDVWQAAAREALRQSLVSLDAEPAPAGEMDVLLGPGWPGILLHEAIGHGLEGDFNRKKTSAFAGLHGPTHRFEGCDHRGRWHPARPARLDQHRR